MTISTCDGDRYPSKYLFQENIHLFNDVIHVYSWLVSWKKRATVPFLMNFSCWKCADDGCFGTMVSLLIGLLYASLQLTLNNCENKNSRNVCLSKIRENIFPRKFPLIQYRLISKPNIINWSKFYACAAGLNPLVWFSNLISLVMSYCYR